MAQSSKPTNSEIKVEELLRLKRHEQPSDAFWSQFDRELHQRMLHTLVKKDPIYVQILRGLTGRAAQTVGLAGAAAAFAFVAVTQTAEISTAPSGVQVAATVESVPSMVEAADLETLVQQVEGVKDYAIDAFTADAVDGAYQRDFGMDRMQVASFGSDAYSVQDATARPGSGNVALASLAF